jgi:serine/threonine protein kinase
MYEGLGYQVEEEIGSGGFKQVFRAKYKGQTVALKAMHLEGSDLDIRARREVKLMTEINSLYIAKIIDFNFGSKDYEAYITEEYISDVSLWNRLEESSLTTQEAMNITDNIFQALLECASRRIVHRDVKPSNILLRDSGDAVLTDFGLARPQDESTMTPWGIEIGTFPYAPPEFIRYDSQLIDQTSDVFSLGIIIYMLLTGKHPFISAGQMEREQRVREMLEATAIPPHDENPSINVKFSKFVMKLIERERANRYPTTEYAYQRFKKVLEELS